MAMEALYSTFDNKQNIYIFSKFEVDNFDNFWENLMDTNKNLTNVNADLDLAMTITILDSWKLYAYRPSPKIINANHTV